MKVVLSGDYIADMIVEDIIICELKANETLCDENENQLDQLFKSH